MAFFGYPHAPRATAQGIHFRSTAIVQSVSGDARDVPLTTEVLRWSYGLGARERQSCPFFGNDARFTGLAQAARRSIIAPSSELTHAGRPYELTQYALNCGQLTTSSRHLCVADSVPLGCGFASSLVAENLCRKTGIP